MRGKNIVIKMTGLIVSVFLASCCLSDGAVNHNIPENNLRAASNANIKLAIAFLNYRQMREAKKKLLLAKMLEPLNPFVWSAFGYYYENVGELAEARKNYEYALIVSPDSGIAHNNYGVFLYDIGKYKMAITHFLLAIKDPGYLDAGSAYRNAGLCALKLSNHTLATKFFQQAALYGDS